MGGFVCYKSFIFAIMSFVYPGFLFALGALAIPVIIHLFNFRRYKTVLFPNIAFLKEVKERTNAQSQLKRLLVLAARLLALTALVLAFAQPFIPHKDSKVVTGHKAVSIYVDNSFSMSNTNADVPLLELARKKAAEIAAAYSPADQFQLLTNDFEGRHQRLISRDQFLQELDEVRISPAVRNISEVAARQKQALGNDPGALPVRYLLSDFQQSTADFSRMKRDTGIRTYAVWLSGSHHNNLYIDTCWMASPLPLLHQPIRLLVRIVNAGNEEVENSRLTLTLNKEVKSISDLTVKAGGEVVDTLTFNGSVAGWNKAELGITEGGNIDFDNHYFISFRVPDQLKVRCLTGQGNNLFLDAVFANSAFFNYQTLPAGSVPYSELARQDFLILNQLSDISSGMASELHKFLDAGGNVLLIPDPGASKTGYNSFLESVHADVLLDWNKQDKVMSAINAGNTVFREVFTQVPQNMILPVAKGAFTFTQSTATNADWIIQFKDKSAAINQYRVGHGSLFVSAVPFSRDNNDLVSSPFFAPMVFRMCIAREDAQALAYFIGQQGSIELKADAGADLSYRMQGNGDEFIPQQRMADNMLVVTPGAYAKQAGWYDLLSPKKELAAVYALNYDRRESKMDFLTELQLASALEQPDIHLLADAGKNLTAEVRELNLGTTLWKVCICFALIFLAIEVLLLRFLK